MKTNESMYTGKSVTTTVRGIDFDFRYVDLPGGPFELLETYFYHDGLRAFSMRSVHEDIVYIANAVDETLEGDIVYLFAEISEGTGRWGAVPFDHSFHGHQERGSLYMVIADNRLDSRNYIVEELDSTSVPVSWFPQSNVVPVD